MTPPRAASHPSLVAFGAAVVAAVAVTGCSSQAAPAEPEPTPTTHVPDQPVLAVIGDSYSQGKGTDGRTWWQQVAERHGMAAAGAPVSGTGYCAGGDHDYASQVRGVAAAHPKLIVVAGSRNDFGCPAESVQIDAAKVYTALAQQAPGVPVVVVGPMWDSTEPTEDVIGAEKGTRAAAQAAHLTYVDGLRPGWLRDHPEWIGEDGVHPIDKGVDALGRGIDAALVKAGAFAG